MKFWKHVPAISDRAEHDAQRHFMIGTGELPWFRQVTFSVWASVEAMHDFSRNSTTHGVAVRRAYDEGWFSEYCFTRFNILALDGIWPGLSEDALGLFSPNAKTIAEAAQ